MYVFTQANHTLPLRHLTLVLWIHGEIYNYGEIQESTLQRQKVGWGEKLWSLSLGWDGIPGAPGISLCAGLASLVVPGFLWGLVEVWGF